MTRTVGDWGGNILAFSLTIALNVMATRLPLGGQTPPEIAAKYPSLFTPAGFTFSIWGLIYLGLALYVVYQALPAQRSNACLAKISTLFKLSCVANGSWLLAWHYDFMLLSVVIMLCILATLIAIYRVLDKEKLRARPTEKLLIHLPFRVYTAWISVATIANISTVQNALGWDDIGTDSITWTLIKLALAGAIGASVVARKADLAFVLVIAWAAFGISQKQVATPEVSGAALTLCIMAVLLALLEAVRRFSRPATSRS